MSNAEERADRSSTALPRPVREGDRLKAGREGAVCGVASVDATGFAFAYNGTRYHRTWEGAKRLGWTHEDGAPIEPPQPPQPSTAIACPSDAAPKPKVAATVTCPACIEACADAADLKAENARVRAELESQRQRANRLGDECGRIQSLLSEAQCETKDALAKLGWMVWKDGKARRNTR